MKKIIAVALMVLLKAGSVFAQADTLVIGEDNKFIYYQVVSQPGSTADDLYYKAALFLKKAYTKDRLKAGKLDKEKYTLNATGGVLVSKKSMISTHEDASVSFNFFVEIKDGKYRYWFTDFVITPYQRDRYANYVPVPGKGLSLENGKSKLSEGDYRGYLKKVLINCREIGSVLKSYTTPKAAPVKDVKTNTAVPKEW